jgi:hypothetical protein
VSAAAASVTAMNNEAATDEQPTLTEQDLAMLELERSWWKHAGAKEGTIRTRFDISPTQHYAALNRLIERPEALAADPMLVKRLRRLRDARRQQRSARRAFTQSGAKR